MPKNDLGVQARLCLNCAKPFIVLSGSKKVFCSRRCRETFHSRLKRKRRRERDPAWAKAELERFMRWLEQRANSPARSASDLAGDNVGPKRR